MNTATIIGGPALVTYRGQSFYSKGDIKLENSKETFAIESDRFGEVDRRVLEENIKVTFTPVGAFEGLSVLWPYANALLGSLIAPKSMEVSEVDAAEDTLTVTAHGLASGDDVLLHVSTGGSLPTATPALAQTTRYYVSVVDANTLQLHVTEAAALAGTGAIAISSAGTGTLYVDRDLPLTIHTFAGVKMVFHSAAVTKMPSLNLKAGETMLGEVEFECFSRNGANWNDNNSRYTISNEALVDNTFNPAAILTQPYLGSWGAVAPWASFETKNGFTVDFDLGLEAVTSDRQGIVSRRLASLGVTAKAQPLGISESELLNKLLLQGSGAIRGRSLSGDNLNISATGVYVRLAGAALLTGPQQFSSSMERVGELEWRATRTFTSGTPNPLFFIGTAQP